MLTPIADNKWSVATILKGLKQKSNFEKENEKSVLSDLDWESLEHVYIVRFDKDTNGNVVRKVIEIKKDLVQFWERVRVNMAALWKFEPSPLTKY